MSGRDKITEQLASNGVSMDEIRSNFEGLIRCYRNNEFRSDYSFVEIKVVEKKEFGWVVLIEDYSNQTSCTVVRSELFVVSEGKIISKSKRVFVGVWNKCPKEWTLESISETDDAFIVIGKPFGKEVLKKSDKFFPRCPLSGKWEEFFV
ncbi:MAG: hypothetical protein WA064_05055 [Candidatus Moraniibacteriota bacterium]